MAAGDRVTVEGHVLRLTHLDKVLYPSTGTTKGDVLAYYAGIAEHLIAHAEGRPATRKRWVNGTGEEPFFEKNLPESAPGWIPRHTIEHKGHDNVYPMVNDLATLTWLGQQAALEIHVPQWRFGPRGAQRNPDRLVLDLDPGDGVGLPECVFVAQELRPILRGMGLDPMPVTSGSKGIHLYAALDGSQPPDVVSEVAHELARALEADHPDLVLSSMGKADRRGKVFLDWSQNNGSKTTVAPYSLRGRERPTVAAPRTWRELASKSLRQLEIGDVLTAVKRRGDPLAGMSAGAPVPADEEDGDAAEDRLTAYRSKRDASKTREPVPATAPVSTDGRSFVIQEHHARRLHWDFRLEHDGVLVSWALPKGEPADVKHNRLAVQTEDHPLEYGTFEGTIAKGEYGAGTVSIWDSGEYELEKWRDGKEVIAVLHGEQRGTRRVALIHTGEQNWLIHRMKDTAVDDHGAQEPDHPRARPKPSSKPAPSHRAAGPPAAPMLATAGTAADIGGPDEWAYELKWDGLRATVVVQDGSVTIASRNGHDLTPSYPEFAALAERLTGADDAVLDGEIVAVDPSGRPDFGLLQTRMKLTRPRDVERVSKSAPVRLLLFDVTAVDGRSLVKEQYDERRATLEGLVDTDRTIDVPPAFEGDLDGAVAFSKSLRLEGVVAKRRDSTYTAGRRSRAWIKIKHHATQEVVIAGWRPGAGRRSGGVGSLLVGIPGPDGLRYAGRVGTGFRDSDLDDLQERLGRLARKTSPLVDVPAADSRDAHWVTPSLVGEVEFAEWTSTGRLRQPSWRGFRPDKDPVDVVLEKPERPPSGLHEG
ncbi:ATP-dependent DNA ligase LigD ligase module /ATP-dependent DNA ligase LigD phosphoesterase module /ATP-dependent DNA ligase LigD polymerase module [Frondihabitans sp. PhB188]|uniref:ATP-dependent DNA ligase n=1 Tax=Frondihabitans sp. PhB188 TaxID=2485200 RepID=UPI000F4793FE|nr:ATP-dependent DNA ligase [Frondihabitans sp. PhB188]ROQ38252.1 ATP-dependent DNA ligase LigD ligase module /ATP-dependent DNA ligase LigD phosphoesterase module /ATP-dependent DNA ligase LigD polymerase module [Frondihabitans sp. PhB188]